jgi:predicted dehydrogenase
MSFSLAEILSEDGTRNDDLRRLMLMCRTGAQEVYVVCVGVGDAFITRYWPTLRLYATQRRLRLLVADRKPLDELVEEKIGQAAQSGEQKSAEKLRNVYEELKDDCAQQSYVRYVNTEDKSHGPWYHHIRADIVLVLVPDEVHVHVAKEWLKRATLILIEKPYNRDLQETIQFEHDLNAMMEHIGENVPATWVCPIDHYLAKISEYHMMKGRQQLLHRIGHITEVEFSVLEAGPIEPWRADALRAGMIYDLFSHVLAMLSIELNLATFRNVRAVKVARHKTSAAFSAETYAHFDFDLDDYQRRSVTVRGAVGKGVGRRDEKYLKFCGNHGYVRFDLDPKGSKQIVIKDDASKAERPIYNVRQGHPELLDTLLNGRFLKEPIGGLTGATAVEILRIMNRIREKIPSAKFHEYEVHTDKSVLETDATKLSLWW